MGENLDFIVILDNSDNVVISDDIARMCKAKKYDGCFIHVMGSKINIHFDVSNFTHENNVIYIPKKLHYMFENESFVSISLIDPKEIQDIGLICVVPITDKFYKGCSQQNLVRFMQGAKIMSNGTIIPELFQIKELYTKDHEKIEFGSTLRCPFRVEVLETHNANPAIPWYMKKNNEKQPEPKKEMKMDYSPVRTNVYKKMYIKNGEVVYVK